MKKNLFYAFVLLAIVFVGLSSSSCGDPESDKNYYVNVDQSTVSFEANGGSTTVLIKSNTSWKISGIPDWLTVSPASGTNDAAVTLSTSASSTPRSCALTISTGEASTTINVSQKAIAPGPNDDPVVGIWSGRTSDHTDEVGQLTINNDNSATFVWYDENTNTPSVTIQYSWQKIGNLYHFRFANRSSGRSDDWDCDLQVTYISEQRIEVQDVWDGEVDDLTYIFQLGILDLSKRTQYPAAYKKNGNAKYIGAWMLEELGDDDYWVCYQVINPDGTGIYQEFDCKLNSFRVTENEYAPFTWTLTNSGNALRVNYNDGGDYETWDVSNINGTTWRDGDDIAYKQTDYTANPSITGTWKWTYYDESLELVLNSNKTGTYKYWDGNKLDESYGFSYTNTSTSLTLTSSQGTKEFSIALLTYNRLVVSARNEKGEVFGMVFKKQ